MAEKFANQAETTLITGVNSSATSIEVAASTNFPAVTTASGDVFRAAFVAADGTISEYITVTNITGTTWTIIRASEDSARFPAVAQSAGAKIVHVVTRAALAAVGTRTIRIPHTWAVQGDVLVASGETDYIVPMFVPVPTGQSVSLVAVHAKVTSGSVSFKMYNYSTNADVTAYGTTAVPLTVAPGPQLWDNTDYAITTNGTQIAPVVTAVSGSPKNLTITAYFDYVV